MKIAVVNDHFSSGPGGQHRIQNLALGFSKLGHEVLYISPYGFSSSIFNIDISLVDSNKSLSSLGRQVYPYFNDFFMIFKKLGQIDSKLDLLLIGLPNTMSKSLNAIYGLLKNVPSSYDFGGLWTSIFDRGKTYVQGSSLRFARPISQFYEDSLALFSSRLPNLVTVPTAGMLALLEKYFKQKAHLIYQPVNTSDIFNPSIVNRSKPVGLIPKKYRRNRLVAVGVKGDLWFVPFLEKLVNKCKEEDVVFMVMGRFPKAEAICTKKKLCDHVYFTGNVPYNVLPHYIAMTHFAIALTHPYLAPVWYAPHNIAKIADYMAMGKAIITDTLAATDYVQNGKTGFLVTNEDNLLEKTAYLLNDQELAYRMGKVARKIACEKLDNVRVAERYLQLIKQKGSHVKK